MIEAGIRRTNLLLSLICFVVYTTLGIVRLHTSIQLQEASTQWEALNGNWYSENCATVTNNIVESNTGFEAQCADARAKRIFFMHGPDEKMKSALQAMLFAVLAPLGLWVIFYLGRWIWFGEFRSSNSIK